MTKSSAHPSAFDLEAFSVGALSDATSVTQHVQNCSECSSYLSSIQDDYALLMARKPPAAFAHQVAARRDASKSVWQRTFDDWRRHIAWGAAGLAASAALLMVWIAQHDAPAASPVHQAPLRAMGPAGPRIYLKRARAENVEEVRDETTVSEGDALRITFDLAAPSHVAVFLLSEHGQVSWWTPSDPSQPALSLPAGHHELKGSAVFDDTMEPERLYVMIDSKPFEPAALAKQMSTNVALTDPQNTVLTRPSWLPKEVQLWTLVVRKRKPS